MKANEFQLRDNTGRELAVYDMNTGRMKYYNLYGNGSLGRAEAKWDSIWVEDPRSQNPGYWSYSRTDSRYYYIKDHLGSIRITIDEAGNVVNAQDYYSFGSILRSYDFISKLDGVLKNSYGFRIVSEDSNKFHFLNLAIWDLFSRHETPRRCDGSRGVKGGWYITMFY